MLNASARLRQDDGFSLVELLVTIVIATVVGGVALSGVVNGMQHTARTQDRIDASNELQIALERMSREVRAADPIVDATASRLEVHVRRDGQCSAFVYRLVDEEVQVRQDVSGDDCETFTEGTFTPIVADVVNLGPLFTYETVDGEVATTEDEIAVVSMEILRDLRDQSPVAVTTVVNVRNS